MFTIKKVFSRGYLVVIHCVRYVFASGCVGAGYCKAFCCNRRPRALSVVRI
jgi:hypothetical protein